MIFFLIVVCFINILLDLFFIMSLCTERHLFLVNFLSWLITVLLFFSTSRLTYSQYNFFYIWIYIYLILFSGSQAFLFCFCLRFLFFTLLLVDSLCPKFFKKKNKTKQNETIGLSLNSCSVPDFFPLKSQTVWKYSARRKKKKNYANFFP